MRHTCATPRYLDDELVVARQRGGVEVTPEAGGEGQRVPAVGVRAEGAARQRLNGRGLREARAPQGLLHLVHTGGEGEERGERRERERSGKKVRESVMGGER